jgi:two-component system alkaline phosphatase synthesis response regulator PhoP
MSEKRRILVVDDEPDFCSIVQGQLEKEGFEVELAYNGIEGLEKVQANPPDAIVLDVMMPEMDGYEVCKKLKADDKCCNMHVTSTRYTHRDGMATEADDYIAKPASAEQISESIKRLLG